MTRKSASHELLDGVENRSTVTHKEQVVLAGKLDVSRPVDVLGDVPGERGTPPIGAANHQRRHPDRPEEVPHVNLDAGPIAPMSDLGRAREAFAACEPACEPGVADHA